MPVSTLRVAWAFLALLAIVPSESPRTDTRQLSFEERVSAQEAIERVYYSHQIGATKSFEEAVPQAVLEENVRTYLKQSVALEEFWGTPVTAEMLQREIDRMARGTRMPERLLELYAALDNDPVLILECLARPALVDRLARSFFAADQRIHGDARVEANILRQQLLDGQLDPSAEDPRRTLVELTRDDGQQPVWPSVPPRAHRHEVLRVDDANDPSAINAPESDGSNPVIQQVPSAQFDEWVASLPSDPGLIGDAEEAPDGFRVWIVMEREPDRVRAVNYTIGKRSWDDWWSAMEGEFSPTNVVTVASNSDPVPAPGTLAGDQAGEAGASQLAPCPPDDTWDYGLLDDLPSPRQQHTAVWTGTLMIVWGGYDIQTNGSLGTGGRYDPATDTWAPTSLTNAPSKRFLHSAVWTGSVMVIWGGLSGWGLQNWDTGGRYDPMTDTWTPTSTVNAPASRESHTAVWTGNLMIVWGGSVYIPTLNTGGRYDPVTDTWAPTSTVNAPAGRAAHTAVWTGTEMIIWGGYFGNNPFLNSGGRYNPATDTWTSTSALNAPVGRVGHSSVWTGSLMIIWGGEVSSVIYTNTGSRYDPAADTWTPTSTASAPSARHDHTAVWTGSFMVMWGGRPNGPFLSTGARYNPVTNSWTATSVTSAPTGRSLHTAVWTGSLMVVWGGQDSDTDANSGGRYNPVTNNWTPTSTTNAPPARGEHSAVWTGTLMIVWGGYNRTYPFYLNTGGRYNPTTDTWTPTSTTNAPPARGLHSAVWTGSLMIIWGGYSTGFPLDAYRYDPVNNGWTPVDGGPLGTWGHSAVWTGSQMIVWGGYRTNTGGRYDPVTGTWTPTSTLNAPSARYFHSAVWTGSRMVVWGGISGRLDTYQTGGQYDPVTDTWSPTAVTNSPSERFGHSAVWTGELMIVWGGVPYENANEYLNLNTGGRYNPATNTWTPTSTASAPSGREGHTAVWTGGRMIVWGGQNVEWLGTGGRYNPATDAWTATTMSNAPPARAEHTAVWTGSQMIVWGGFSNMTPSLFDTGGRYSSTDDDGDGFSTCAGDCDDADITTYPGAAEMCDGRDNDCDVATDEELGRTTCGVGACLSTVDNCVGGVPQTCVPGAPTAEMCNGLDDDCDGTIDGGLGPGMVEVSLDPVRLWPPNHRMVDIHATVTVSEGCPAACPTPPTVVLISATCNEPDDANGIGDGQTVNDIQDATLGSADFDLKVRAERGGTRNGRLYEVIYAATDCFGDTSVGSGGVFVPHDEGGQTEPVFLEVIPREGGGAGSYALQWSPVADATAYNVLGGRISTIRAVESFTVIEESECVASGLTATSVSGGMFDENPASGEAFFFLTEYVKGLPSGYGTESGGRELVIASGDSCH